MGGGGSKAMDAIRGLDLGAEIDDFNVQYVGSVPVKAPTGNDVCSSAVERLLQLKLLKRPLSVKVTSRGVYLIDPKTYDIIKVVNIEHISFVAANPGDDRLISFFENDASIRLITCHTFFLSKDSHTFPVAISDAFKQQGKDEAASTAVKRRKSSKKDALAASTAKKEVVEKGEAIQTYPCQYHGTVNVSSSKGDDTLTEAVDRILKMGQKVIASNISIHPEHFCLSDNKASNEFQLCSVRDISHAKILETSAGSLYVYIIHDRRLDTMNASACALDAIPEGTPSVRRAIDTQQKAMKAAAAALEAEATAQRIMDGDVKAAVKKPSAKSEETGRLIGVFEATYMGMQPARDLKGADVVDECLTKLLKSAPVPEGCFVSVSTEGIKTIESLSHEILNAYVLKDISFTTVTGKRKDFFAFIEKDESLGLISCHLFKCAGERAFDITTAFGEAFKGFAEEQKRTGGNPFKPSGERETPEGPLFHRQVHRRDLIPLKAIGAGQFGQVYLAEQTVAEGEGDDGSNKIRRAVKMLRGGASDADKTEYIREAEVMLDMTADNLVELVGVVMQQHPWLMVLEFLPYGDLRNVLKGCDSKGIDLNYEDQLYLASQVAIGMHAVSKLGMVHMDLAARNVLVGLNMAVKVADFGITRKLPEGQDFWQSKHVLKLPVKWCSIEALDERLFSEASDVWAFGVVMWEIINYGMMPYKDLKTQEVQRKVREGLRLVPPPGIPDEYCAVMATCFREDRGARPSFNDLKNELGAYLRTKSTTAPRDIGKELKAAS